mmetsp:Transcript_8888/g.16014  ORF Transcript_8888/g.16014 Transcript_8888/m.16014 type:complete len:252 (-) Transcript_8888:889-1644(-)
MLENIGYWIPSLSVGFPGQSRICDLESISCESGSANYENVGVSRDFVSLDDTQSSLTTDLYTKSPDQIHKIVYFMNKSKIPNGFKLNYRIHELETCVPRSKFDDAARFIENGNAFSLGWTRFLFYNSNQNHFRQILVIANVLPWLWVTTSCSMLYRDRNETSFSLGWVTNRFHQLIGEERVRLKWNRSQSCCCSSKKKSIHEHGSLTYEICSISKPATPIAFLCTPYLRWLQKRFAKDSCRRMHELLSHST